MKLFIAIFLSINLPSILAVAKTATPTHAASTKSDAERIKAIKKKFRLRDGDNIYELECKETAKLFFQAYPIKGKNHDYISCWDLYHRDYKNIEASNIKRKRACSETLDYMSDEYRVSTTDPKFIDLKRSCETKKDPTDPKAKK